MLMEQGPRWMFLVPECDSLFEVAPPVLCMLTNKYLRCKKKKKKVDVMSREGTASRLLFQVIQITLGS